MSANPADDSKWKSVRVAMAELGPILDRATAEVIINEPNLVLLETETGYEERHCASLTFERLLNLARSIASASKQNIDESTPTLSTTLLTGERVQIVIPPATSAGTVSFTFRKPTLIDIPFEDYTPKGFFVGTRVTSDVSERAIAHPALFEHERQLLEFLRDRDFDGFWRLAVASKQNIITSGPTGSGKTTFMKSLANLIPLAERLITVEDAKELTLLLHRNKVHLFYSRGGQGVSNATPKELLEATLRMNPSRVLLAEVRGSEAWYYVRSVMSAHPGGITSMHASDEIGVFDQLTLLIKESDAGATVARDDLKSLLVSAIDITTQIEKTPEGRRCVGIYYNPLRKRGLQ